MRDLQDPLVMAVRTALKQAFAPLVVDVTPCSAGGSSQARFEVSGPGWTHHHAIYLTRDGRLTYTIERELQLDDPACFEKVASDVKANIV